MVEDVVKNLKSSETEPGAPARSGRQSRDAGLGLASRFCPPMLDPRAIVPQVASTTRGSECQNRAYSTITAALARPKQLLRGGNI